MAHPYRNQADSTHKSKTGNMGKSANLDLPIMRAVGENSSKKIAMSSASMQHKGQAGADGMKRGGHVGKPKHHKPPVVIAAPAPDPTATPDPAAMAGAGGPPPPAGPPMMPPGGAPPMKSGGKVGGVGSGSGRLNESKHAAFKPIKG